jgi:hypothetical protein
MFLSRTCSTTNVHPTTIASLGLFLVLANAQLAQAAVVNWVTWNSPETLGEVPHPCGQLLWCSGVPPVGSATGRSRDVGVTYTGEVDQAIPTYKLFSWAPTSTFAGLNKTDGVDISDGPTNNTFVLLAGGPHTAVNTIRFSAPVHNPVLAISQLGQYQGRNGASGPGRIKQTFYFLGNPSFKIGPDGDNPQNGFIGGPLTQVGESVYGTYGAGVVQFIGNYSSISWTDPVFKYYTFITVGDEGLAAPSVADPTAARVPSVASVAGVATSVPEPSTWAMMLLSFAGLGFVGYRQTRRAEPQAA